MKKLLFALFIALIAFGVAQATWTPGLIDCGAWLGTSDCIYNSMWVDPDTGYPAIAYTDVVSNGGYLKYTYYNGSSWTTDILNSGDAAEKYTFVGLAVGTDDKPWISAFWDTDSGGSTPRELVCWYKQNGSWTKLYVDSSSIWVGEFTDICVDSNNRPIISYYDAYYDDDGDVHGTLKVAWRQSNGTWNIERPDLSSNTLGKYTGIAYYNGAVYVSYYDQSDEAVKIAYRDTNGDWECKEVDSDGDCGRSTSICVNGSGNPSLVYYKGNTGDLKYAVYNSRLNNFTIETIDTSGDVGMYCSLAFYSSTSEWSVAYYDATNGDLKYAYRDTNGWHTQTVYSAYVSGRYCNLALNSDGNPRIAFTRVDQAVGGCNQDDTWLSSWSAKAAVVNQPTLTKVAKPFSISTLGNPAKNTVTCGITMPFSASVTLSLYDLSGRMVQQKQVNAQEGYITESMDVSNVSNGVYVLVASSNNQRNTSRVIISH